MKVPPSSVMEELERIVGPIPLLEAYALVEAADKVWALKMNGHRATATAVSDATCRVLEAAMRLGQARARPNGEVTVTAEQAELIDQFRRRYEQAKARSDGYGGLGIRFDEAAALIASLSKGGRS